MTDCKSVFDTVHRDGPLKLPSERRLALDVAALREAIRQERPNHNEKELYQLPMRWVPTRFQLADCLTKDMCGDTLRRAMAEGTFEWRPPAIPDECGKHGEKCDPPAAAGPEATEYLTSVNASMRACFSTSL